MAFPGLIRVSNKKEVGHGDRIKHHISYSGAKYADYVRINKRTKKQGKCNMKKSVAQIIKITRANKAQLQRLAVGSNISYQTRRKNIADSRRMMGTTHKKSNWIYH